MEDHKIMLRFEEEVEIVSIERWKNCVDVVLKVRRRRFAKAVRDLVVALIKDRFPETYIDSMVKSNRIGLSLMPAPPNADKTSFWKRLLSEEVEE